MQVPPHDCQIFNFWDNQSHASNSWARFALGNVYCCYSLSYNLATGVKKNIPLSDSDRPRLSVIRPNASESETLYCRLGSTNSTESKPAGAVSDVHLDRGCKNPFQVASFQLLLIQINLRPQRKEENNSANRIEKCFKLLATRHENVQSHL